MLDAISLIGANNPANDTDFDAWTKANRIVAAANAGQMQGFKNRLINGAMNVAQRTAGAAVAIGVGSYTFALDRWAVQATGAAVTAQQVTTSAFTRSRRALRITGAASNTNVQVRTRLEADDTADLAGQTVAIAFDVFHTLGAARQFQVSLARANAADTFATTTQEGTTQTTVAVPANAATRVVVTIPLSAAATTGLELVIATNGGVLAGQTVDITAAQLERGVEDTTFDARPVALELALCQRYYARIGTAGQGPIDNRGMAQCTSATTALAMFCSPVPMRATPTAADVSAPATWQLLTAGGGLSTVTGAAVNTYSPSGVQIVFTGAAGLTAGHATQPYGVVSQTTFVGISAEL